MRGRDWIKSYRLEGQVIEKGSGKEYKGLRVEIYDRDPDRKDDYIGEATTDSSGRFHLAFNQLRFGSRRRLPKDEGPDIYCKVFKGEKLLKSTEEEIVWDAAPELIEITIELDSEKAGPLSAPSEVNVTPGEHQITVEWESVPNAATYNLYWSTELDVSPETGTLVSEITSPFTHKELEVGTTYYYVITALNETGESSPSKAIGTSPKPSGVVPSPPSDLTVFKTLDEQVSFLYSGEDPLQKDVEEGVFDSKRTAVLRGNVRAEDGEPLEGVEVTVFKHEAFGYTTTREDGMFDLVVNGGGRLTVRYEKDGYLTAQRQVNVPWQEYTWLPEVVLITPIDRVDSIDLTEDSVQVARGNTTSDTDGERQPTLLFPAETTAPVDTLDVRITEYSIGEDGPARMPDELPRESAYTYAVDLSADDVEGDLVFDSPVFHYVENFLGFPVGGIVPVGYYDYEKAAWVPSDNGRIVRILEVSGGSVRLDIDGTGQAATADDLSELEITEAELRQLGDLYQVNEELWRVPIPHFSSWDCNWPSGLSDEDLEGLEDLINVSNELSGNEQTTNTC